MSTASQILVPTDGLPPEHAIFGRTEAMRRLKMKADKVATANVPVLICGESGTGKEIVSQYIHRRSPWSNGPFVKVNCPAIPGTLLESELFGYEKGAFTGAYGSKPGRVEQAHHGTLFLDEIAELDSALQAKLLQLLQDGQFSRIGGQEDRQVDVRVICATNRQLEKEIESGTFREDLFYRINVIRLELLPLRERVADIPDLVDYFLECHQQKYCRQVAPPSSQLMRLMQRYSWPGNIRQLENLVKRYVILGLEETISGDLCPTEETNFHPAIPSEGPVCLKKVTRQAIQELERKIILRALEANSWNRKRTASELRISYRALLYKIRQAGLPSKKAGGRDQQANSLAPAD